MSFFETRGKQLRTLTETDRLEYEVAPHSTSEGERYEEACLALALLRCLRRGLRFALSSNDAAGGKFDDLVLCWSNQDRPGESALFVQLKHKTSKKHTTIRKSSLIGQKKYHKQSNKDNKKDSEDFSIEVYHKSYEKIRESLEGGSYSLVLCTNLDLHKDAQDIFVPHIPESVPGMELLESGGRLYSLNPDDDDVRSVVQGDDQFLQHFYLFCNQSSNRSIRDKICTELELTLGADESSCRKMCDTLCSSIREWMNTQKFCLTSSWSSWLDIVDTYVKDKVTTCNSTVTKIKYTNVETLRAYIECCNPARVRPPGQKATALSATKVHQVVCAERHIVVSVACLTEQQDRVLGCWGPFCPWLVLVDDDDGEHSYDILLHLKTLVGPKRRLVIVSYKGDSSFKDSFEVSDIDEDSWKQLMGVTIKLNSEQYTCHLEDLCDAETLKAMLDGNPEALVALSQLFCPVRMGQDLDPLPENYIPRQLTCRTRVTQEFFSSLGYKEVCIMSEESYKLMTDNTVLKNTVKFEELENCLNVSDPVWPLLVITSNIDRSAVQMICSKYADVFLYIVSHADDECLYTEEQTKNLLQVVDGDSNQVILEGKPGIGKTTLLKDTARQLKEDNPAWWILRIDLSNCSEVFDNCDSGVTASRGILLQAVYNKENLGVLEHLLLQHCLLKYPRIICLVDGFDEICPDYADKCLRALQELAPCRGKLVVTTRPSVTGCLEAALGVVAHSLPEFSEKQLDQFHSRPLSEMSVTDKVRDLLKIPLFSIMYAELLEDGDTVQDVVTLFDAFFERKLKILYKEKLGDDLSKPLKRNKFQKERMEHEMQLGFLAMSLLFPRIKIPHQVEKSTTDRDDLVKAGVIYQFVDDKPIFIHRTFAEHFLAKWCFSDFADSLRATVYRSAISDNSLEFFVESFDRIASRGHSLLTAVLNGAETEVIPLLEKGVNPEEVDMFGRSSLHLAAACSHDSTLLEMLVERLEVVGGAKAGGSALGVTKETRGAVPKVNKKQRTRQSVGTPRDSRLAQTSRAAGPSRAQRMVEAPGSQRYEEMSARMGAVDGLLRWTPLRYAAERRRWRAVAALLEAGAELCHLGDFQRGLYSAQQLWRLFKEDGYRALCDHILGKDDSARIFQRVDRRNQYKRCLEIKVGLAIICEQMSLEQYNEIRDVAKQHRNIEVEKLIDRKMQDVMTTSTAVGNAVPGQSRGSPLEESRQLPLHKAELIIITLKKAIEKRFSCTLQQLRMAASGDMAPNAADQFRLHGAAQTGDVENLRKLIRAGIDVNTRLNAGLSAIHVAAYFGHADCIRCLHSADADIDAKDEQGYTPLHYAALMGRQQTVKVLLIAGADALIQDSKGCTPLHMAATAANAGCVRLLAYAVNKLELTERNGLTALHIASLNGDDESLKHLLDAGAHTSPVSDTQHTPLHMAAFAGSAECVRLLVQAKVDVAARDAHGLTALHCAAVSGSPDCVRELLRAGASLQEKDEHGNTPLHCAAEEGTADDVRLLLQLGADVHQMNNLRRTPLHHAAYKGCAEIVKILLGTGAAVLAQDSKCHTPLHLAAFRKNTECVRLLACAADNLEVQNIYGQTALHMAALKGDDESLKHLLHDGAHTSPVCGSQETPLHLAVRAGSAECVRLLVQAKADVVARDAHGRTALHYAAVSGSPDCVREVLRAGADLQEKDERGNTPLHCAAKEGTADDVRLLLQLGADAHHRNNLRQTPLHYAAHEGCAEIVKILLGAGADALAQDSRRNTPLHLAAFRKNTECVWLLACAAENLEVQNINGQTALHMAALNGDDESLKHLLLAGAHTSTVSDTHKTPLHLAAVAGSAECVRLLVQAKADVAARDAHGRTALHCAAVSGSPDCVRELLRAGADLQEKDEHGNTPLHCAAADGSADCVRLLLEEGADVHQVNDLYQTALHVAAHEGKSESVQLLIDAGAEVLAQDSLLLTPLLLATNGNNTECVRLLTSAGQDRHRTSK